MERVRAATSWRFLVLLAPLGTMALLPVIPHYPLSAHEGRLFGIAFLSWIAVGGAVALSLWRNARPFDRVLALPLVGLGVGAAMILLLALAR